MATSTDLQKKLGVNSLATANAWADEYNNLALHPVQRNARGARDLTEEQITLIVEAFHELKSGKAEGRYAAILNVLQKWELLHPSQLVGVSNSTSNDVTVLIPPNPTRYQIQGVQITPQPNTEIWQESRDLPSIELPHRTTNLTQINASLQNQPNEIVTGTNFMAKFVRISLTFLRGIVYVVKKLWLILKRAFSVRDSPIWTHLPLNTRKHLSDCCWLVLFALLCINALAFLLTLLGFAASYVAELLKIPFFFTNWRTAFYHVTVAFVGLIILKLFLPTKP